MTRFDFRDSARCRRFRNIHSSRTYIYFGLEKKWSRINNYDTHHFQLNASINYAWIYQLLKYVPIKNYDIAELFLNHEAIFAQLRVTLRGCGRKIHFLHRWKILGHRYDGVLRRLADHRSNVRTNSSDYPCLVENESARSFQPACSSGSAPFYLARCALPTNWWMFTKLTASFSRKLPPGHWLPQRRVPSKAWID